MKEFTNRQREEIKEIIKEVLLELKGGQSVDKQVLHSADVELVDYNRAKKEELLNK